MKQKPKVDKSKLTAAGKRQVGHVSDYYDTHKVKNKGWNGEDVGNAVILQEKKNKDLWKK